MKLWLLSGEQIFQNWRPGGTSRIIGTRFSSQESDQALIDAKKWIAQHHTSRSQPYFYRAKKVNVLSERQIERIKTKGRRVSLSVFAATIGVAVIVYWKTEPFFKKKWAECEALAKTKEYGVYKRLGQDFKRYATPEDIWSSHKKFTSRGYIFRNLCCITSPIWGFFFSSNAYQSYCKPRIRAIIDRTFDPYDIVVERSRDERVCPSNFNISQDVDPLTQEEISPEKLASPRMIYLSNYVTDAKAFVLAILRAEEEEFSDPVYKRKFTVEERSEITAQIQAIFQISEERWLHEWFENAKRFHEVSNRFNPNRYETDLRALDERGEFTEDAQDKLQEFFGHLDNPTFPEINTLVDQAIEGPLRQSREILLIRGNFSIDLANLIAYCSNIDLTSSSSALSYAIDIDRFINHYFNLTTTTTIIMPIGPIGFTVPVSFSLTPFLIIEYLRDAIPSTALQKTEIEALQIKNNIKRHIRSQLLERAGFNRELMKDDRFEYCIESFKQATGVDLKSSEEPPLDG